MITLVSFLARHRFTRFLLLGGTAAVINLLMMFLFVDVLEWETLVWKNLANAISMEVSLLYSFFVYRAYVWGNEVDRFHAGIGNQLLRYHGAAGSVNLVRFLAIFPLLDLAGVHHLANTLIGIPAGCVMNYFISSKFVFASNAEGVSALDCAKFRKIHSADREQAPFSKLQSAANSRITEPHVVHRFPLETPIEQAV